MPHKSANTLILGDVASVISGFAFKSAEFGREGIPVVKIANIGVGRVDMQGAQRVSPDYLSQLNTKYQVHPRDILVSLTGSQITQPNSVVGRVARQARGVETALLNQRAGKVILRDKVRCDADYLYWWLLQWETRRRIAAMAHGAASQANVSPTQVQSLSIDLPPLDQQRRIASAINGYEALIENCRARVSVLAEMLQRVYESWFEFPARAGRFDFGSPVDIPGCKSVVENVESFSGTRRYYETSDLSGIWITGTGAPYDFRNRPSRAQKQPVENSVWFARMKDTFKVFLVGGGYREMASTILLSSGMAGILAHDQRALPFLYATLVGERFQIEKNRCATGATQVALTNAGIAQMRVVIPPADLVWKFGQICAPWVNQLSLLQQKAASTQQALELLLPKLLSGGLDVSVLPEPVEYFA